MKRPENCDALRGGTMRPSPGSLREPPSPRGRGQRGTRRTGGILLAVLVALLVVSALAGVVLRSAVLGRQALVRDQAHRQVRWLLSAGRSLAEARLADDAAYAGETWSLADGDLPRGTAEIVIAVAPAADSALRSIRIQAVYIATEQTYRDTQTWEVPLHEE